jgi:hypothetical protein
MGKECEVCYMESEESVQAGINYESYKEISEV